MVDYKQILRLRSEGVSQRGIAEVLGCSRNTVAAVFAVATEADTSPASSTGRPAHPTPEQWLTERRNTGPRRP